MATPSDIRETNERVPKKGGVLDKYKWWLIGGLAVIAVAVFYFTSQSNQSSQQANQQGTQPGIDPNTGLPYSSEMMGGMGGFPFMLGGGGGRGSRGARGPAGPAGPPGPRGKRGPKGKEHHKKKKHHHHHHMHSNGNAGSMSSLGSLQAFGGNKMNAPSRAAHNRRIVPAGMATGPGLR